MYNAKDAWRNNFHMDLAVVAEGVADEAQLERLGALGCDLNQGYLFSLRSLQKSFVEG